MFISNISGTDEKHIKEGVYWSGLRPLWWAWPLYHPIFVVFGLTRVFIFRQLCCFSMIICSGILIPTLVSGLRPQRRNLGPSQSSFLLQRPKQELWSSTLHFYSFRAKFYFFISLKLETVSPESTVATPLLTCYYQNERRKTELKSNRFHQNENQVQFSQNNIIWYLVAP